MPFSERDFYLAEFRGRSLAVALPQDPPLGREDRALVEDVLADLAANATSVILLGADPSLLCELSGGEAIEAVETGWVGRAWRQLQQRAAVGVVTSSGEALSALCSKVVLELQLAKLVWLGRRGMLWLEGGRRRSLVGLAGIQEQALAAERVGASGGVEEGKAVAELLREFERMIAGGLSSVSACLPAGLADELFTYAGSGTFYAPEGYTEVRSLGLDDFDAAEALIRYGIEEGYLLDRSQREIEVSLANGMGAFVEGRYLAGICALMPHPTEDAGEIASLYALTRFIGEGVGVHLVHFAADRAREQGMRYVFACTTSERVEDFFLRLGFGRVGRDELPASKWQGYSSERLQAARCLRLDLD
ncbi:MAG: GNAT family N-acetyltransferase [bacterium]|nr:GNAT family N-acetyltransferase [bacterium]